MIIMFPLAGKGERFTKENYKTIKPLIKVLGKEIFKWSIDSLKTTDEKYYLVTTKENDKQNLSKYFNTWCKGETLLIENSKGAAHTIYLGLEELDIDENEPLLLLDSDTFTTEDIIGHSKEYLNKSCIFYSTTIDTRPIYSYINIENDIVKEIAEKKRISDNYCIGSYLFSSISIFKKYYKKLNINNNEEYISMIYAEMLKDNEIIYSKKIENVYCLGTPDQIKVFSDSNPFKIKNRFCFDLDGTLVSHPIIKDDYSSVQPIQNNINYLKKLYDSGNYIIIYTARRMRTHNGNVNKVIADIAEITIQKLKEFGIPYHELSFGKPYAQFYIDDLAINCINDNIEYETGFYFTRPDGRNFNKIEIIDNRIIKRTNNKGELYYYSNIPKTIEYLFPKVYDINYNNLTIKMEKVEGITFSYLLINSNLNLSHLDLIFEKLEEIHQSSIYDIDYDGDIDSKWLSVDKLKERLKKYTIYQKYNTTKITDEIFDVLKDYKPTTTWIHGDPVFTNVFYKLDGTLKFIDMRGNINNTLTGYGDPLYDHCKVLQSLYGYDFIHENKEITHANENYLNFLKNYYLEKVLTKYQNKEVVMSITKSLYLSLLPLHDDIDKVNKYFENITKII